jgi:hypothetical protein
MGKRKSIILFEGWQASPARPSDKGSVESEDVKTVRSGGLKTTCGVLPLMPYIYIYKEKLSL